MPITQQELDSFQKFAAAQLHLANPPESLQECLTAWRRQREYDETVSEIRQSDAEFAAGLGIPANEAIADIRHRLGLTAGN